MPALTRFHVARFGLEVIPGPRYAVPVGTECVGLCIACGEEIVTDDYVEIACWSAQLRESLPALTHPSCLAEMNNEW